MQACHILLGRHWQYDRKVNHNAFSNRYSFVMNDVPIILKPLTLKEVYEDPKVLRQRVEEFEKEKAMKRERICVKNKRQASKRRAVRKAMRGMNKDWKKESLRGCVMRKRRVMRMQKES